MNIKLTKCVLSHGQLSSHAFLFWPETLNPAYNLCVLMTHGYTSHKDSILNWASRLSSEGIPTALFDLPGHYLGSFNEVESLEDFKRDTPGLFLSAWQALLNEKENHPHHSLNEKTHIIFCGHSLGSLMAIKAMKLPEFKTFQKSAIAVGLGLPPTDKVHLFETAFYKNTLQLREQLVSPALKAQNMLPWIKEEKENWQLPNEKVHIIAGQDDLVVGKDGPERLALVLEQSGATVTLERPPRLPHHQPELAAGAIHAFIKKHYRT